jgi:DNA-binding MarR family transcriptional regulator
MLTVSHIAHALSTGPHPPSIAEPDAINYCIYCGVALSNPTRGIPREPLTCPLHLNPHQEWRSCAECLHIASAIYYYRGGGKSYLPHLRIRGAALDIYVWILRQGPYIDDWIRVPVPQAAEDLRYSRGAITAALMRLRKRGLLEKRPRSGRYAEYRPLIWQRPKGE